MGTAAALANLNAGMGPGSSGMSPSQSFSGPPSTGLAQPYEPMGLQPQQQRLLQQLQAHEIQRAQFTQGAPGPQAPSQPQPQPQHDHDQGMLGPGYHQTQGPNFM
eukprot:CAMPEP_0205922818 /NCGR_PEP_ID=MMETSP1325-20131115/15115_1 /ASSEMBLY_ACC=CAM_ASM_000708 /TAXON_ID=236786 /ORGANISM="Florenciella sp., Strain RCC1007" /LENGTH=104 /DNA_ID=CAMNT_0053290897 /DNA_START=142 /DNA_END=456 /DNA_ORIENTATION=+